MRHHYPTQPDLQITPIEKIRLPLKSRDKLLPILAGLQWIWMHPTLKAERFALLEAKILAGKQAPGCTGMGLWQILVLGVVRLGLAADWDRLEDMASHVRQVQCRRRRRILTVGPRRDEKSAALRLSAALKTPHRFQKHEFPASD